MVEMAAVSATVILPFFSGPPARRDTRESSTAQPELHLARDARCLSSSTANLGMMI